MLRQGRVGLLRSAAFSSLLTMTALTATYLEAAASPGVSEDVPVPGGTVALARAVGIDPVLDHARFAAELARLVYGERKELRVGADSAFRRLVAYFQMVEQLETVTGRTSRGVAPAVEYVPIPLPAGTWTQAVFRRPIAPSGLFAAIMTDPAAALLLRGLAALDDETLQFLVDHPALLRQLYEHDAPTFAAFAAHVRIRDNRIVPPGGDRTVAQWEALLGEATDRPDRFMSRLFAKDRGRIAYLYDAIGSADSARAAFALGLWMPDEGMRLDRFKALASAVTASFPGWSVEERPFDRPLIDFASILLRVRVGSTGAPECPASRTLWARALDGSDGRGAPSLGNLENDQLVDAAWLVEALLHHDTRTALERLDQFSFGQRVFGGADPAALVDVLEVIQAFPRVRMLFLTLERMRVRRPALYAALARQAAQVTALDEVRRHTALAQFQGAIAFVERLTRVGSLDRATAETLLEKLDSVPFSPLQGYMGGLLKWLRFQVRPALGAEGELADVLLEALAGTPLPTPASHVSWEGEQYRVDLVAQELRRHRRGRQRQGDYSVTVAVSLHETARRLNAGSVSPADIEAAIASLKGLTTLDGHARVIADRSIDDLVTMRVRPDANRVKGVVHSLLELVDVVLGEALVSLSYASAWVDPRDTQWADDVARRHVFGVADNGHQATAWALPILVTKAGVPWHVRGAVLGLDIALAPFGLRRIDTGSFTGPPAIDETERRGFAASVALIDPRALRDDDRDAIADAVTRGRRRVTALADGDGDVNALVREIAMDGWRVRALQWTLQHAPQQAGSWFSMTELLALGGWRGGVDLDPWGMSAIDLLGCICTRFVAPGLWNLLAGRPHPGLLVATMADLNVHVAVALAEMRLPAVLAKSVLAAAFQDFADRARPSHTHDWLTRVRAAQAVSRERIEDYVAAATIDGPLVLDTDTTSGRMP